MINDLLKISLDEMKNGYTYSPENKMYTCITCHKTFETGEMFPTEGKFYEASKAVQIHIREDHGGMFQTLASIDKKYTGLTENQKEILSLMYQGMPDNEIAKKTGVAPATVRRQRYAFREKAKHAKAYLAIYEIVEKSLADNKGKVNEELVNVHGGAKMVDDRYFITKEEEDKIASDVFETLEPMKLKVFSSKEKKKIVILRKISSRFTKNKKYTEKEVNEILKPIYEDFATMRRYLIEYGFMERTKDCKEYWLST